jgi:hypothetical protein
MAVECYLTDIYWWLQNVFLSKKLSSIVWNGQNIRMAIDCLLDLLNMSLGLKYAVQVVCRTCAHYNTNLTSSISSCLNMWNLTNEQQNTTQSIRLLKYTVYVWRFFIYGQESAYPLVCLSVTSKKSRPRIGKIYFIRWDSHPLSYLICPQV